MSILALDDPDVAPEERSRGISGKVFSRAIRNWFITSAIAVGGYFGADFHAQYKEHLRDETARGYRLAVVEADLRSIDYRLRDISAKLDRLIERSK